MNSCVLDALSYGLLALACRLGDQSDSVVVEQIGFFQLPHSELACITQILALLYGSLDEMGYLPDEVCFYLTP